MAVQEQIRRNQQMQTKTFEWKMNLMEDRCNFYTIRQISPFFHFCGYYCHLYCEPIEPLPNKHMVIGLKGYAAPFKNLISCYYSLSCEDNCGREHFSMRDTIRISKETIDVHIFDGILTSNINAYFTTYVYFVFSWSENEVNASEQENCTSVVERATQTENTQPPSIRNIGTETENATNLLEHATTKETICPFTTAEHYTFLETLSNDLGRFYEDKTDTDCVLKVDKIKFPVHRSVLAARSSVFAAMFHHDMFERRNGEVDILDVNADALGDIIFFMYTGKIRGLSPDTAASMYTTADKYSLHELRDKCLDFLIHNLTVDNICDAALVAHTHAEAELENKVVQFVKVRMQELIENEKWRHFSATHFLLANKLLSYALIASQMGNI